MKTIKKNGIAGLFAAITLSMLVISCNQKDDIDSDTNAAKNENSVEKYYIELNDIADQVAKTGSASGFKVTEDQGTLLSSCAVITIDTSSAVSATNPDTIIVDFGTGCIGSDGRSRSGKIIISTTGRYFDQGTVVTITPQNYFVNGNGVSGSRVVTNTGNNSSGQPTFTVQVSGTVTLANNGGTITWSASRIRTWIAGYDTPLLFADDEISVTGSSNGTNASGGNWSTIITSPLVHKRSCREIVSGSKTVTPASRPARIVDYGNGTCDNTVNVTINGNTYTITIN
jgi:hypothetical protein